MQNTPAPVYSREAMNIEEDEISLLDIARKFWMRRGVIFLVGVLLAVILGAGGLLHYFLSPAVTEARIEFRLTFSGASEGKFPNGQPFNPQEIIATNILLTVYERNRIESFGIPFDASKDTESSLPSFSESISLTPSGASLLFLQNEYAAKLANDKLTVPERRALEDEYEKRRASMRPTAFVLAFLNPQVLPKTVVDKCLLDLLAVWAEHAEKTTRVNRYSLNLKSSIEFDITKHTKEMLPVWIDKIDAHRRLVMDDIESISKLPGAPGFVASQGDTLQKLQERVHYLNRFRLRPLQNMAALHSTSKPSAFANLYFLGRLSELEKKRDVADKAREMIQASLQAYDDRNVRASQGHLPTLPDTPGEFRELGSHTPSAQLGSGFLEMIIRMVEERSDITFRQELVQEMINLGRSVIVLDSEIQEILGLFSPEPNTTRMSSPSLPPLSPKEVDSLLVFAQSEMDAIQAELTSIAKGLQEFLDELATHNIDIRPQLYRVTTSPLHRDVRIQSLSRILMVVVAAWLMGCGLIIALLFISDAIHRSRDESNRMGVLAQLLPDLRNLSSKGSAVSPAKESPAPEGTGKDQ